MTADETAQMLWENYYTLSATPVEAMADIWAEFDAGHLYPWVTEEHGVALETLLEALCILTRSITEETLRQPASKGTDNVDR